MKSASPIAKDKASAEENLGNRHQLREYVAGFLIVISALAAATTFAIIYLLLGALEAYLHTNNIRRPTLHENQLINYLSVYIVHVGTCSAIGALVIGNSGARIGAFIILLLLGVPIYNVITSLSGTFVWAVAPFHG